MNGLAVIEMQPLFKVCLSPTIFDKPMRKIGLKWPLPRLVFHYFIDGHGYFHLAPIRIHVELQRITGYFNGLGDQNPRSISRPQAHITIVFLRIQRTLEGSDEISAVPTKRRMIAIGNRCIEPIFIAHP